MKKRIVIERDTNDRVIVINREDFDSMVVKYTKTGYEVSAWGFICCVLGVHSYMDQIKIPEETIDAVGGSIKTDSDND